MFFIKAFSLINTFVYIMLHIFPSMGYGMFSLIYLLNHFLFKNNAKVLILRHISIDEDGIDFESLW